MIFSDKLRILGWSQNELARRLGLHVNTVSRWGLSTARSEIPRYAVAYVDLALELRGVRERVKKLADEI